jgi:uncharacterized protein YfeS
LGQVKATGKVVETLKRHALANLIGRKCGSSRSLPLA